MRAQNDTRMHFKQNSIMHCILKFVFISKSYLIVRCIFINFFLFHKEDVQVASLEEMELTFTEPNE